MIKLKRGFNSRMKGTEERITDTQDETVEDTLWVSGAHAP
jgi:hypothetical protein